MSGDVEAPRAGALHVVAPAAYGGIESVVQSLAFGSLESGRVAQVAALLQTDAPSPFVERLRLGGVSVTEIRCGRRRYAAEVRAVADLIRNSGASVVHSHSYHPDIVALFAARRARVPVVAMLHGFSGGDWKNRAYEAADKWLMRFFDGVICVADTVRDQLVRAGCPPERITVIQNGHAPRTFAGRAEARALLGLKDSDRALGWVGRLSPAKGPDLLVEAVSHFDVPDACVVVIGDGPEREEILNRRASLGIAPERLRLIGAREDAARLLPAFDALVLSSRTEGTPMVALEAMAAGVPIVSFAVGGIPAVLDDASAWLVKPGDVSALAVAMRNATEQPSEVARRTARARQILEQRFGLDQWLARIDDVYVRARVRFGNQ